MRGGEERGGADRDDRIPPSPMSPPSFPRTPCWNSAEKSGHLCGTPRFGANSYTAHSPSGPVPVGSSNQKSRHVTSSPRAPSNRAISSNRVDRSGRIAQLRRSELGERCLGNRGRQARSALPGQVRPWRSRARAAPTAAALGAHDSPAVRNTTRSTYLFGKSKRRGVRASAADPGRSDAPSLRRVMLRAPIRRPSGRERAGAAHRRSARTSGTDKRTPWPVSTACRGAPPRPPPSTAAPPAPRPSPRRGPATTERRTVTEKHRAFPGENVRRTLRARDSVKIESDRRCRPEKPSRMHFGHAGDRFSVGHPRLPDGRGAYPWALPGHHPASRCESMASSLDR